ncbi:MAG: sensor domain-containing protein [Dehalococcoidia bacterium]|nr:sensor domain-containing protein [Dehalococcoidia bacterium]
MTASGSSLPRRFFGVAENMRTYARLLYVLVSFPIGIAVFVTLVTVLAVGGGMAVTVVGIPLLVAAMYGWCAVVELERVLANLMLGSAIRPLPFSEERGAAWVWPRLRRRLTNPYTWRSLAFLMLRFPVGTAGLVIVTATFGLAVSLVTSPATYWIGEGNAVMAWRVDTLGESWIAAAIGAVLMVPALHVINLTGWAMGKLNEALLQSPEARDGSELSGAIERTATATLLWPGLVQARHHDALARVRMFQFRIWAGHLALYLVVMLVLVFMNGAATPERWWVLWPVWGWGIAIALHTGYYLGGHLGGHFATYLVSTLGFFVIDSLYTDRSWFYWPMMGWGIVVAAHAYAVYGFSRIHATPALVEHTPGEGDAGWRLTPAAGIVVDEPMRTVRVDGEPVEVTPREFELLALLTGNPGRPFSREELLDRIWKDDYEVTDRTIDTHVQRLRKKLGPRAEAIQTVWGIGYRYQP